MKTPVPFLLLLCACFAYCKSNHYTADKLPARQIRWGEGGGFTGRETVYILLDNGQLFKKEGMKEQFMEVPSTKKKTAKQLYKRAEELRLMELDFQDPGNIYSFIEIFDGDQVRRIVWGGSTPVPQAVADIYKELQSVGK
jgi:hypothetical protein